MILAVEFRIVGDLQSDADLSSSASFVDNGATVLQTVELHHDLNPGFHGVPLIHS